MRQPLPRTVRACTLVGMQTQRPARRLSDLRIRFPVVVAMLALVVGAGACAPPVVDDTDAGSSPFAPGEDQTVTLFEQTAVYFAGEDNRRDVQTSVVFPPATETFSRITLAVSLTCPAGGCDFYDRLGSLFIVGDDDARIEFARFVTPFGVASSFEIDVTDLRPRFVSVDDAPVEIGAFIDTWVGPGSDFGAGWQLSASLQFEGGTPSRRAIAVQPLWMPQRVVVGDPARPASSTLGEARIDLPPGSELAVWTFLSGHGQGNAHNCAEFCPSLHALTVDSTRSTIFTRDVWREDCDQTPTGPQPGTWTLSRAGWCPGAAVDPWIEDIDAADVVTAVWDPGPYENTCRPDSATCGGCTLGTGCDYDGGAHTEPGFEVSALVVVFE